MNKPSSRRRLPFLTRPGGSMRLQDPSRSSDNIMGSRTGRLSTSAFNFERAQHATFPVSAETQPLHGLFSHAAHVVRVDEHQMASLGQQRPPSELLKFIPAAAPRAHLLTMDARDFIAILTDPTIDFTAKVISFLQAFESQLTAIQVSSGSLLGDDLGAIQDVPAGVGAGALPGVDNAGAAASTTVSTSAGAFAGAGATTDAYGGPSRQDGPTLAIHRTISTTSLGDGSRAPLSVGLDSANSASLGHALLTRLSDSLGAIPQDTYLGKMYLCYTLLVGSVLSFFPMLPPAFRTVLNGIDTQFYELALSYGYISRRAPPPALAGSAVQPGMLSALGAVEDDSYLWNESCLSRDHSVERGGAFGGASVGAGRERLQSITISDEHGSGPEDTSESRQRLQDASTSEHPADAQDTIDVVHDMREFLLAFYNTRIVAAGNSIYCTLAGLIENNDCVLIFGNAHLLYKGITMAQARLTLDAGAAPNLEVIVVDTADTQCALNHKLISKLLASNVKTTYCLVDAVPSILKKCTKVIASAYGISTEGSVLNRIGASLIADCAAAYKIPFIVASETFKITEKVMLDSILANSLAELRVPQSLENSYLTVLNPMYDLVLADKVTVVVTEYGCISASAIAVLHRDAETL